MRVRSMLMAAVVAAAVPVSPVLAAPPEIEPMPKVKWGPGGSCKFVTGNDGFTPAERASANSPVDCSEVSG